MFLAKCDRKLNGNAREALEKADFSEAGNYLGYIMAALKHFLKGMFTSVKNLWQSEFLLRFPSLCKRKSGIKVKKIKLWVNMASPLW